MTDPSDMVESYGKRIMQLEQRLIETELSRDSWKREAEMNQEAADKAADYAARLAEVYRTLAPLVDDDNRPVEALARHAVARLAEAEALVDKWHMMERPYIGGYEKGPNPSYLCRHRYRLADCITCLNEHLATEQKP